MARTQNRLQFVATDSILRPAAILFPATLASGARSRSEAAGWEEASEFEVTVQSEAFGSGWTTRYQGALKPGAGPEAARSLLVAMSRSPKALH